MISIPCDILLENRKPLDNFDDQNDWLQCISLTNVFRIFFELVVLNFVIRYDQILLSRFRCMIQMANKLDERFKFFTAILNNNFQVHSVKFVISEIVIFHIYSQIYMLYIGRTSLSRAPRPVRGFRPLLCFMIWPFSWQ